MPLEEMSPNIQEADVAGRKRSHDEYAGDLIKVDGVEDAKEAVLPAGSRPNLNTPQGSPALTEAGSSTPARKSPSPQTPTRSVSSQPLGDGLQATSTASPSTATAGAVASQPVKRKKLTTAEREARDKEQADRKKEREEKAAVRAAEKAKEEAAKVARAKERDEKAAVKAVEKAKEEEAKATRAKERDEKRKAKEEEERVKAQQRDERKRKKEEEQKRLQEEQEKKARSQKRLSSFFKVPTTPKKSEGEIPAKSTTPQKDQADSTSAQSHQSEYQKLFKPFFIRAHTQMAHALSWMDDETKAAKSQILDEYFEQKRTPESNSPFDPIKILALPGRSRRGKVFSSVKDTMDSVYQQSEKAGSGSADGGAKILAKARCDLSNIPVKVIAFSQDVRPPYYGTMTSKLSTIGENGLRKLARQPLNRNVLSLDYGYDSEAEWQDDDGEDLDVDDDEEELDDEDDMEGFLDDSEDAGLARRVFANAMEPESTGVCFEDNHHNTQNDILHEHRMEIILDKIERHGSIDPWSSEYWGSQPKNRSTKAEPSGETAATMRPPPAPSNAFERITAGAGSSPALIKLVKDDVLDDVKRAILNNKALSKVGIVDFIFHQFRDRVSRTEVKNTLEYVAEKKGTGKLKEWELKPGHEIST